MIDVASRRHQRVNIYARPGNHPWGSQRGTFLSPVVVVQQTTHPTPKTNVLINHGGHACLSGFSLLTIDSDQPTIPPPTMASDAIRWASPELIDPSKFNLKESRPTKYSDCYALGMVIYEVLCEQVPFAPHNDTDISPKIMDGERPKRPKGREGVRFTDDLWRMLGDCWRPQPNERPSLDTVLGWLQGGGKPSGRRQPGIFRKGWVGQLVRNGSRVFKGPT